jgi:hypothetical protein
MDAGSGRGGVNGSGMLYTDAGPLRMLVYLFRGGWAVTLGGEVLSILVMRRPGRLGLGLALAAGCLAPVAYEMLWIQLAWFATNQPESSDPLVIAVVVGLAVCVFAAPLSALVLVFRTPGRQSAPF